jgi:alpha-galactosidase
LAVFNWTERPNSHRFSLSDLKLAPGRNYKFTNIFSPESNVALNGESIQLDQPAHSVKLLKIVDTAIPAAAPSIQLEVPDNAKVWEDLKIASKADPSGVPALSYKWDFGDGTSEQGREVRHTYTRAGNYTVRLVAEGIDGIPAEKQAAISVSGDINIPPPTRYNPD